MPTDVLSHNRLEELDTHACHLTQGNKVEDIYGEYARYEHDYGNDSHQDAVRDSIIIERLIVLCECGICAVDFKENLLSEEKTICAVDLQLLAAS